MEMRWVILGAPGVGKGTQAKRLAAEYRCTHISTGEMLRAAMKTRSTIGKEVKSIVESGNLVPDEIMAKLLFKRMDHDDCRKGFLLDGFPRTLVQGEILEETLNRLALPLHDVIYIHVDEAEIVRRLSERYVCEQCGHNMIARDGDQHCEDCGGHLIRRSDDEPETVKHRLNVYRANTEPLIAFYENKGLLRRVDGLGTVDAVSQRIRMALEGGPGGAA